MDNDMLTEALGDCVLSGNKIFVDSKKIRDTLVLIKEKFDYTMLKSITAVDAGDEVELIYDLYSIDNEESVIVSTKVQLETESISDIFGSAQADENEIHDMFGIMFIGNSDLKRLYMPENWNGYPLRKDYVQDDTRLVWNDSDDNA